MRTVTFLKPATAGAHYNTGEIAGFPDSVAADLIDRGIAEAYSPEAAATAIPAKTSAKTVNPPKQTKQPYEGREESAGDVAIPDNWETMEWNQQRGLASKLTTNSVGNKEEALAAIKRELDFRG